MLFCIYYKFSKQCGENYREEQIVFIFEKNVEKTNLTPFYFRKNT